MKADSYLESIFSHAVALSQNGRMRNEIYCKGRTVFIANFDNTVILNFGLPSDILDEGEEISFEANDYDSNDFFEEDGKIVFRQSSGGFVRKKICGKTQRTFDELAGLYNGYVGEQAKHKNVVNFHIDAVSLLDESLSHIEISSKDKEPVIIQRDVYSGSVIRLEREKKGFGFTADKIQEDFGPIGIRTSDFLSLFTFNDEIKFCISSESSGFVIVEGNRNDMVGVVAKCVYDEMGTIKEVLTPKDSPKPKQKEKVDGGKKQKVRRRQQKADSKVDKGEQSKGAIEPEEEKSKPRRRGIRVV
jgi:hypothetical protein